MRFFISLLKSFFYIYFHGHVNSDKNVVYLDFTGELYRNLTLQELRRNVRRVDNWDEVSFKQIFLRKIRIISYDKKKRYSGYLGTVKRILAFIFLLNDKKTIYTDYLLALLLCKGSKNRICVRNTHVAAIYALNFPDFKVDDALYSSGLFRSKFVKATLKLISFVSRNKFVDNSTGVTILTNFFSDMSIRIYKKNHPRKYVVWHLHDRLSEMSKISPELLSAKLHELLREKVLDEASSYSFLEAKQLNILYRVNAVSFEYMHNFKKIKPKFLFVFIGSSSKQDTRLKAVEKIKQLLSCYDSEQHLQTMEYFVDNASKNKVIPYEEYLSFIAQSMFVVDLCRVDSNEGLSYRVAEAFSLEKKIITDRTNIKKMTFYDPSRFFILDDDSDFNNFLSKPFKPLDDNESALFNSDELLKTYR